MRFAFLSIILLAVSSQYSIPYGGETTSPQLHWPIVTSYTQEVYFPKGESAAASIIFQDNSGKPVYQLDCHTFLYEDDPNFDYSGDFECKLTSLYSQESVSTLLTSDPNQPRDWWSRGRFLAEEVQGSYGDCPEYGRIRTFRLRGFELRLELADIKLSASSGSPPYLKPRFASFRFKVELKLDPQATSSLAECPKVSPCSEASPPCYSGGIK